MTQGKKVVYFDGSCSLCSNFRDKIESSSRKDEFINIDITKDKILHNFTKEELMKQIYVVGEDGKVYKNIDAIFKILETYPNFKFLVKIGRAPILRQLLGVLYKFLSSVRHYLDSRS